MLPALCQREGSGIAPLYTTETRVCSITLIIGSKRAVLCCKHSRSRVLQLRIPATTRQFRHRRIAADRCCQYMLPARCCQHAAASTCRAAASTMVRARTLRATLVLTGVGVGQWRSGQGMAGDDRDARRETRVHTGGKVWRTAGEPAAAACHTVSTCRSPGCRTACDDAIIQA